MAIVVPLGLVALVLLLWTWLRRPEPLAESPRVVVTASPTLEEGASSSGVVDGEIEQTSDDCADDRIALSKLTMSVPAVCEAELLATSCAPPVPHPPLVYPPERQLEIVAEELADCPGLPEGAVRTDCTEYPCAVFVRWEEVDNPRCAPIAQIAAFAGERGSGVEAEWFVFAQTAPMKRLVLSNVPLVDARAAVRERQIAPWLADSDALHHRSKKSCAEVDSLLAAAAELPVCERARLLRGCESSEPTVDTEVVQRHLDAARELVEALAERCDALAAAPHALDCTELPCVLGVDAEGTERVDPRNLAGTDISARVCDDEVVEMLDTVTSSGHPMDPCGRVAVLPLWDVGGLRQAEPDVEERYFTVRGHRLDTICHAVEAQR